jgi:hypothetical protein
MFRWRAEIDPRIPRKSHFFEEGLCLDGADVKVSELLAYSADRVLPGVGLSDAVPCSKLSRFFAMVETGVGLLSFGLLASYVHRAVSRRMQ